MEKLYIIIRSDLDPGLMLAQTGHAVSAFACDHPDVHRAWHLDAKNIVVLAARDGAHLTTLLGHAAARGIAHAAFVDSDLGPELTAIALAESAKKLVQALPLALSAAKRAA